TILGEGEPIVAWLQAVDGRPIRQTTCATSWFDLNILCRQNRIATHLVGLILECQQEHHFPESLGFRGFAASYASSQLMEPRGLCADETIPGANQQNTEARAKEDGDQAYQDAACPDMIKFALGDNHCPGGATDQQYSSANRPRSGGFPQSIERNG